MMEQQKGTSSPSSIPGNSRVIITCATFHSIHIQMGFLGIFSVLLLMLLMFTIKTIHELFFFGDSLSRISVFHNTDVVDVADERNNEKKKWIYIEYGDIWWTRWLNRVDASKNVISIDSEKGFTAFFLLSFSLSHEHVHVSCCTLQTLRTFRRLSIGVIFIVPFLHCIIPIQ